MRILVCEGIERLARHAIAAVVIGAAVLGGRMAAAQESAIAFLEPRVEQDQYTEIMQSLDLTRQERLIPDMLFNDYQTALQAAAEALDIKADEAGRQRVTNAVAGKASMPPEELRRLRADVLRIYGEAFAQADEALDELLTGIQMNLDAAHLGAWNAQQPRLRRELLLHPRQSSSSAYDYAGDGVDVILLVAEAQADGGELATVPADALRDILAGYESAMDALLIESAAGYRQGRLDARIAGIERDAAVLSKLEGESLARWKNLYELNESAVRQIAQVAENSAGEQASRRWSDRFDRACFTWLFSQTRPDRQFAWMTKHQDELGPEATAKARQAYETYQARRTANAKNSIELMVRGRMEFHRMLYSMMDPTRVGDRDPRDLYETLLKNSGEQTALDSSTAAALDALLNDAQRQKMNEWIRNPRAEGR